MSTAVSSSGDVESVELRCENCDVIYRLGYDASSLTAEELVRMMPNLKDTMRSDVMVGPTETKDIKQL